MMSIPQQPDDTLSDADRQRLVAYLDGELPVDESRAVESDLAENHAVRVELQRLERVWNALDELPRATVDDAFTRSTVELVAIDAERDVDRLTTALPVQRRRRRWGAIAACVVAMLVGAVATRAIATRNDRHVLAHLPVIYQYDALGQFEQPEFLRQLRADAPNLVSEFTDADYQHVPVAQRAADWRALIDGGPGDRAAWIAKQSDNEKLRLQRAVKRFHGSPAPARESAHRVLAGIESQPDADQLLQTAVAYQTWLATQPATVQSQLRQLDDPAKRVAQAQVRYNAGRKRAKWQLKPVDAEGLRRALAALIGDPRLRVIPEKIGGRRPPGPRWLGETAVTLSRVTTLAKLNTPKPERALPMLGRLPAERREGLLEHAKQAWPPIETTLLEELTLETQQQLADLNPRQRAARLGVWVNAAAVSARRPDDATLEAFFASETLSDAERQELLALPIDQMKRSLGQRYLVDQFGDIEPPPAEGRRHGRGPGKPRRAGRGPRTPGPRPGPPLERPNGG